MTAAGLAAAFLHMLFHSVIKMLAFFSYGTVAVCSGREYVRELDGMGRRMPLTFLCFTVSACSLAGIPLFCGFVSKWNLLLATVGAGQTMGMVGAAAILTSTLLITAYMFDVVIRAFFPRKDAEVPDRTAIRREGFFMGAPLVVLSGLCILFGLWSEPVKALCQAVAAGQF
jgi:multicomponent Na+:H+ antiporter subunit D